jgi:UDP-glucose 4-epimerase
MTISVVTGGAGFIGSHLVDLLLLEGHEVRVIDNLSGGHKRNLEYHKSNPKLKFYNLDINNISSNSEIFTDCNYCFHLAGIGDIVPSIQRPLDYFNTNTLGTINVLEAARYSGVTKFIYASSSSCYGLADTPTTESHLISPMHPYAMSKYQGEQAVFHWSNVYGMSANSICIFNAYGPRVRTTGAYGAVFGVFFKQKLANKPFTIVGDGEQKRDFVYVTDVASAFLAAAYSDTNTQRYNIGNADPKSINSLVALLGKNEVVYLPKRPGEPDVTFANNDKAKRELGWQPKVSFEDGVAKMLDCIHHWEDAPLWDEFSIADATKDWFHYMTKK